MARGSTSIRAGGDASRGRAAPNTRDTGYVRAQPVGAWPLLTERFPSDVAPAETRSNGGHDAPAIEHRAVTLGFEHRALRQHAHLVVAPEFDQQLARDRDDADPPLPRAPLAKRARYHRVSVLVGWRRTQLQATCRRFRNARHAKNPVV